jgi:hypothetical protein
MIVEEVFLNEQTPLEAPRTIGVARLNSHGVFLGVDVVDASAKTEGQIEVPLDCDLTPGRYQLKDGTFVHIAAPAPATDTPPVVALNAIAADMLKRWDDGATLPQCTLEWLDFYVRSIDFQIAKTDQALATRFLGRKA